MDFFSFSYYLALGSLAVVGGVACIAILLLGTIALKATREHALLPSSIPWVGRFDQLLSSLRANWRGATQSASLFAECYDKVHGVPQMSRVWCCSHVAPQYSLKERIAIVPTWTKGPQVLLPPSMIPWLARQPSAELNAKDCTFDNMQVRRAPRPPCLIAHVPAAVHIHSPAPRDYAQRYVGPAH
jgi:hypothetical protein